jgi:glycosyltransferase involved in cell wall biosynthesis
MRRGSDLLNRFLKRGLGLGLLELRGSRQPRIMLPGRATSNPRRYLSVIAIFKNEARYIAEWLEFQRLVGFEHAYLYDNGSTDDSAAVLRRFVEEGFATVVPWALPWQSGGVTAQTLAYAHAIANFGADWRWMAFLDLDEFLFPTEGESLLETLHSYEDLPAIAVFWTNFGFCGNESPPDGLVIENYTMRAPFPTHAKPKSIVNPAEVVGVSNPHLFDLNCGPRRAYTETRQLFEKQEGLSGKTEIGPRVSVKFRLNHYYTRSRSEFDAKVERRRLRRINDGNKVLRIADLIEATSIRDEVILRFAPALRARLSAIQA